MPAAAAFWPARVAGAVAGVVGFAGTTASAEPDLPTTSRADHPDRRSGRMPGAQSAVGTAGHRGCAVPAAVRRCPRPPPLPDHRPRHLRHHRRLPQGQARHARAAGQQRIQGAQHRASDAARAGARCPIRTCPTPSPCIADRVGGDGLYTSNAALVVYKLVGGDFDPKEAISHGLIDSQQLPAWRSTDASLADFGGMPSAAIEGTYRQNNMTLNTIARHVLATSGPDKYLVSLSVTTSAAGGPSPPVRATDAIVNGFKVGSPDAPPPAPPARRARAARPAAPAALPAMPLTHRCSAPAELTPLLPDCPAGPYSCAPC